MANTIVYNKFDYVQKLRSRLNYPTCWKDILNVKYSDVRAIVNGAWSTESTLQTGTRGTAYGYSDYVLANDTLTISNKRIIPMFVDEADRYQQSYVDQMSIPVFQARKTNEYLEAQMLAQHASYKDFGATDLANTGDDDTTQITVSATNIDDIIRAVKRKMNENNGVEMGVENGYFITWRAQDMEILEAFAQANGFTVADMALKNGIPAEKAFHYMGMYHYLSNSHTANHLMGGIRKVMELGILRGTFGKAKFIEDPGKTSGVGIVSRVDYGWNMPTSYAEMVADINVA
jgi:hypothetical protein